VRVLALPANRGKGAALIIGCKKAQGELVAFLDADLELHPALILRLWRVMADRQADIVIGSKHHPDSQIHFPTLRHLTSGIYARLIKLLSPACDTQTGIKLFRLAAIQAMLPTCVRRFALT
jgi:glycosyltransferase involved in cell wall biosynthesis